MGKARKSLSLRLTVFTEWNPGLHRETLFPKTRKKKKEYETLGSRDVTDRRSVKVWVQILSTEVKKISLTWWILGGRDRRILGTLSQSVNSSFSGRLSLKKNEVVNRKIHRQLKDSHGPAWVLTVPAGWLRTPTGPPGAARWGHGTNTQPGKTYMGRKFIRKEGEW